MRRTAWACSKVAVSISGWCAVCSDQIHLPASFHRILVVWPSATSATSIRTSSLRCRFQTWRPV